MERGCFGLVLPIGDQGEFLGVGEVVAAFEELVFLVNGGVGASFHPGHGECWFCRGEETPYGSVAEESLQQVQIQSVS